MSETAILKAPAPLVDLPVTFLPTTKLAVDKLISDTFGLPNLANKPLLSFNFILGTPNENVVDFVAPVGKAPLQMPVILLTAANVIDNLSGAIEITLLNL